MYCNVKLSKRLNLSIYTNIHTRFFLYILSVKNLFKSLSKCVNKNDLLLSEMVHSKKKKTTNQWKSEKTE